MHRILFHMDADGHAAGAVVYRHLTIDGLSGKEIAFHPINYGMPIPPEIDYEKDTVYMVDFSLQPVDVMEEFAKKLGDRFIWIDHHSTSIEMAEGSEVLQQVKGLRAINWEGRVISGCELTWLYLEPDKPLPEVLKFVGDWDTWRWKGMPEGRQDMVQALQYYLKSTESNPRKAAGQTLWWKLLEADAEALTSRIEAGEALLQYQRKEWRSVVGAMGFEADFQGLKAVMANTRGNSEMFQGFFNPEKHDIMVTFQLVKGEYLTVSMYTPKTETLHLGNLAKKLGEAGDRPSGGGHAGAAGFQCGWKYFETLFKATGGFSAKK